MGTYELEQVLAEQEEIDDVDDPFDVYAGDDDGFEDDESF